MKAKIRLTTPDDVLVTMEITMELWEWKGIRKDLAQPQTGTAINLRHIVDAAIQKATVHFEEESEES